ncbi:MAG: tetratricopeptide repeat protein [Bacteroidota bacterium]
MNIRDKRQLSELNKIIGESYFNLGKYQEAIPYLQAYEGKKGQWNNTDFYQLGYAYYKQQDYDNAINEFNKIIDGRNQVAQNAYYHLGESYINLDKKPEALNAFRNASQMDFDERIKEDAWLNYAKLSYEIGNPYQSVPQVLTQYLELYPDTSFYAEIEILLIDSYISSKNYEEALELLEGKSGYENKLAYQKAAFYRGLELYNELDYARAKDFFEKSLSEPRDPMINVRATFWLAETDYNLSDYNEALIGFKQFSGISAAGTLTEYQGLDYHLAYTYFKLKEYKSATQYFQKYLDRKDANKQRINDAYLRLGDGYFVTSQYRKAIEAYDKASTLREIETDYAAFQSAMSYGYLGEPATKTKQLEQFVNRYKKSALRDDAFYELGNTYVKSNDITQALSNYEKLSEQYPNCVFIPKAQLRRGLVYYNANQSEKALTEFKSVAERYPKSEEAVQAVATARLIYIDIGEVDEYARWVRRLDFVEVTDAELDNTSYLAAEKQYIDGKTDDAIKQFNSYLNSFPDGIHALKSNFYVAQLYYQKNLPENALSHYKYVVDQPKNEFTEQSSVKLAEIYLNNKNWDDALPVLEDLEKNADYSQNIQFAKSNLMKVYYQTENYSLSKTYSSELLDLAKDNQIKKDAQIILARSAMALGDQDTAKEMYIQLSKTASGSIAAESLYQKAFFENESNSYKQSNETLQKLVKDYSSYKEFSAKGLVVMAKNYYALDDAFQATYILESVIENFQDYPLVIEEAKQVLSDIKSEQSKTNSSIETGDN